MSLFYEEAQRPFPVPLIAFERLSAVDLTAMSQDELLAEYRHVLAVYCGVENPTEADFRYLYERLTAPQEDEESSDSGKPSQKSSRKPARTRGTAFAEAAAELGVDRILLAAVGYDWAKAKHLYCEADRTVAMAAVETFLRLSREHHTAMYEASLYGFGGKYVEEDEASHTLDLTSEDVDLAELQNALRF
jgi:hypothetical protein